MRLFGVGGGAEPLKYRALDWGRDPQITKNDGAQLAVTIENRRELKGGEPDGFN